MSRITDIFEIFGVQRMPWVIRVYILLFLIFCFLLVFSAMKAGQDIKPEHLIVKLFSIATDGLKLVIGALLGALSLAAEKRWGPPGNNSKKEVSKLPAKR